MLPYYPIGPRHVTPTPHSHNPGENRLSLKVISWMLQLAAAVEMTISRKFENDQKTTPWGIQSHLEILTTCCTFVVQQMSLSIMTTLHELVKEQDRLISADLKKLSSCRPEWILYISYYLA